MQPPTITFQTDPHWHVVLEFENGNRVMVCDASGEDKLPENDIVITGIHNSLNAFVYRTYQERPAYVTLAGTPKAALEYVAEEMDIVGEKVVIVAEKLP